MNILLSSMLQRRGLSEEFLKDLDKPVTSRLQNIDLLVRRLHNAYRKGFPVTVLPDYDMDGIMSGIIGFAGLSELGFNASLFEPDPKEGYGFNAAVVDRLMYIHPGTRVILSCDTGVSCHAGIARAHQYGVEVLVTDHHTQQQEDLSQEQPDVLVDPMSLSDTYEFPQICGAFVLWKCLMEYANQYGTTEQQEAIRRLRVFAGIGTVSDMMPMMRENRDVVRDAIAISRMIYNGDNPSVANSIRGTAPYVGAFQGLFFAISKLFSEKKIRNLDKLNEEFFGFYLAPMFNTLKRMGQPIRTGYSVFFEPSPYVRNTTTNELYDLNEKRKIMVANAYEQMNQMPQPFAPYLYLTDAYEGIRGPLAQKVREKTGLPASVVALKPDGSYSGSGRSPEWFRMLDEAAAKGGFGVHGHQGAFGIGFRDQEEIKRFYDFMSNAVPPLKAIADEEAKNKSPFDYYISTIDLDADTTVDVAVFDEFIDELSNLAPFGEGFKKPKGRLTFSPRDAEWSVVGPMRNHLKAQLKQDFAVMLWGAADRLPAVQHSSKVIVDGALDKEYYRGRPQISFKGEMSLV